MIKASRKLGKPKWKLKQKYKRLWLFKTLAHWSYLWWSQRLKSWLVLSRQSNLATLLTCTENWITDRWCVTGLSSVISITDFSCCLNSRIMWNSVSLWGGSESEQSNLYIHISSLRMKNWDPSTGKQSLTSCSGLQVLKFGENVSHVDKSYNCPAGTRGMQMLRSSRQTLRCHMWLCNLASAE